MSGDFELEDSSAVDVVCFGRYYYILIIWSAWKSENKF